jgi:hypothetical protein
MAGINYVKIKKNQIRIIICSHELTARGFDEFIMIENVLSIKKAAIE